MVGKVFVMSNVPIHRRCDAQFLEFTMSIQDKTLTTATREAQACDCPTHVAKAGPTSGSRWSALAPLIACALCPACLTTYGGVLSLLGLSLYMTEAQHFFILILAVSISASIGFLRARRTRRWIAFAVSLFGCALLLLAHFADDHRGLTWGGVIALLGSSVWEYRAARRRMRAAI
jgi:drug/metabolite transporter (DMT)-like permease